VAPNLATPQELQTSQITAKIPVQGK